MSKNETKYQCTRYQHELNFEQILVKKNLLRELERVGGGHFLKACNCE